MGKKASQSWEALLKIAREIKSTRFLEHSSEEAKKYVIDLILKISKVSIFSLIIILIFYNMEFFLYSHFVFCMKIICLYTINSILNNIFSLGNSISIKYEKFWKIEFDWFYNFL